jgi:hypothetical protein
MTTERKLKDTSSSFNYAVRSEQVAKEYLIALESMAIIREKLDHCVRTAGVNQFSKCTELREKYLALCNDRYRGMIFPSDFDPGNRQVPGLITTKKQF